MPTHSQSEKRGDAVLDMQVGRFKQLVLGFTLIHPRVGTQSDNRQQGQWIRGEDDLAQVLRDKQMKHVEYHDRDIEYGTLAATTYGRVGEDFVRFLWYMASRSNRCWEATMPESADDEVLKTTRKQNAISYTFMRSIISAVIAKATVARLVHDIVEDGLGFPMLWDAWNHSHKRDINELIQSGYLLRNTELTNQKDKTENRGNSSQGTMCYVKM